MAIPGEVSFTTRHVNGPDERSGRGRIVQCKYDGEIEIVEHR